MRVYKDKKLTKVVCNNCGKNIKVNNSTIEEGVFFADYKLSLIHISEPTRP